MNNNFYSIQKTWAVSIELAITLTKIKLLASLDQYISYLGSNRFGENGDAD